MIDQGRVDILGVGLDVVDYEAAVDRILGAAQAKRAFGVSALAVHGVMTGVDDAEHATRLNALHLVTADGQPVRWAMNLLHDSHLRDRVYGPKLTLLVCRAAAEAKLPVYFYGSNVKVLNGLRARLPELAPGIVIAGMRPSLFRSSTPSELDEICAEIRDSGAVICMVGLGCPRQEIFVYENMDRLSMPMLAVGAAFDYHAGLQSEPPEWMQRFGLQWLYRLGQDPKRLWRRYLILNPRYVAAIMKQRIGRFQPAPQRPPQHVGCS